MKPLKINNIRPLFLILFSTIFLGACDETKQETDEQNSVKVAAEEKASQNETQTTDDKAEETPSDSPFKTIEWIELMPKDDLEALLNPPEYLSDIVDGSAEDQISSKVQSNFDDAPDDRYQQALVSTRVVPEMEGQSIRIPGFVVPVQFDDQQVVTQFFLVPFFGACLHMPPPPPNQIIFVESPDGLKLDSLYDPFWISGVLQTTLVENEIARSSYSLDLKHYEKYYE